MTLNHRETLVTTFFHLRQPASFSLLYDFCMPESWLVKLVSFFIFQIFIYLFIRHEIIKIYINHTYSSLFLYDSMWYDLLVYQTYWWQHYQYIPERYNTIPVQTFILKPHDHHCCVLYLQLHFICVVHETNYLWTYVCSYHARQVLSYTHYILFYFSISSLFFMYTICMSLSSTSMYFICVYLQCYPNKCNNSDYRKN